MKTITTGSCYCGSVTFDIRSTPRIIVNCHCNDCKKRNGSAFSTYMAVRENKFDITAGHEQLQKYTVETVGEKVFCSKCGTPIYNNNYRFPGVYMIFYGAVDPQNGLSPSVNVYCSSKNEWVDNISALESFQEGIERR